MSTIPAVLAALVALGEATLDGDEWQVLNGTRSSVTIAKARMLAVGDGDIVGEPVTLSTMEEHYTVPWSVTASLPGTDQTLADDAALAAYEAYRDALRVSDRLGLAAQGVLQALPTDEFVMQRQADENGRHTSVRSSVRVLAHP